MIRMTLQEAASITGAICHGESVEFTGASIDTRRLQGGELFVAIKGERVDGHDYIDEAAAKGAAAVLVDRNIHCKLPCLQSESSIKTLQELASSWRRKMPLRVLAVTGSNGKTTIKNMLNAVLSLVGATVATRGNYNNEIGVPLSLCDIGPEHEYGIFELGAGKPGDIAFLTEMARPDISIISNATAAHLQGFGTVEAVAKTKGQIVSNLPPGGFAILNHDDPWFDLWLDMAGDRNVLTFGMHQQADVCLVNREGNQISLATPVGSLSVRMPLLGHHNALNACAVVAAALCCGINVDVIRKGLESMEAEPGRLQLIEHASGATLINDSYNANPASVAAAIRTLSEFPGEKCLVMGDMAELGADADVLHEDIGNVARQAGINRVMTLGVESLATSNAFGQGGRHYADLNALAEDLQELLHPGMTCLVKGSRSSAMERVLEAVNQGINDARGVC